MGLRIGKQAASGSVVVDRRLWLTADKDRLVEDGDPAAAFLWASAGKKRPVEEAKALGYMPGGAAKPEEPASEETPEVEDASESPADERPVEGAKAAEEVDDKAAPEPPNKGRKGKR